MRKLMDIPAFKICLHVLDRDLIIPLVEFAARENTPLYLVGGTVRNLLLGRETEDLDFAVDGDAFSFAREFADMVHASFVALDEERGTARVVFRGGSLYMDFSRIRGMNIMEDLKARDFTINAMAIDLSRITVDSLKIPPAPFTRGSKKLVSFTGGRSLNVSNIDASELEVIDPYGGIEDLNSRLIRLVSAQSIEDDPLRMLRAYRFAAVLGFAVHDSTSAVIQNSVGLLDSVSAERIRDEIFKTLAADDSVSHIEAMDEIGLLEHIFPEIAPMKGMEQNEYHHLDVWGHSILTLEFFEQDPLPDSLRSHLGEAEKYLDYEFVKGRSRESLLKLAAMMHDVGKPATRTMDKDGRIRFFDHNIEGDKIIKSIGRRLKLANREIMFLRKIIENHMYPLGLIVFLRRSGGQKAKNRAIRRFIQRTGSEWLAILLISFADLRATQGPRRGPDDLENLVRLIGEIAGIYHQENHSPMPRLVTGRDIMTEFDLPASPIIGELLKKVKEAQIDGTIKNRDDAMNMVRDVLSKSKFRNP